LVVAQSSSEIPEGLMNNPVYRATELIKRILLEYAQCSRTSFAY